MARTMTFAGMAAQIFSRPVVTMEFVADPTQSTKWSHYFPGTKDSFIPFVCPLHLKSVIPEEKNSLLLLIPLSKELSCHIVVLGGQ